MATVDSQSGKVLHLLPRELKALEIGGQKEIDFSAPLALTSPVYDIPEGYIPRLEAEYRDIYERKITSVQQFRIDSQEKKAFLGDLYFTVNGRRLGGEVAHND